jgi:hypothetical protein
VLGELVILGFNSAIAGLPALLAESEAAHVEPYTLLLQQVRVGGVQSVSHRKGCLPSSFLFLTPSAWPLVGDGQVAGHKAALLFNVFVLVSSYRPLLIPCGLSGMMTMPYARVRFPPDLPRCLTPCAVVYGTR